MIVIKKIVLVIIPLLIVLAFVVYSHTFKRATFTNLKPTIVMGNYEYIVTSDTISQDKLGKRIGKVTKIIALVSYLEENNPYKKPRWIYNIGGKNVENEVALEMNEKYYVAKFIIASP